MAHSEQLKARAMALLVEGHAPGYVAKQTGVPYATVKRWQQEVFGDMLASFPALADAMRSVGEIFPGLTKNGHKKKKAPAQK